MKFPCCNFTLEQQNSFIGRPANGFANSQRFSRMIKSVYTDICVNFGRDSHSIKTFRFGSVISQGTAKNSTRDTMGVPLRNSLSK